MYQLLEFNFEALNTVWLKLNSELGEVRVLMENVYARYFITQSVQIYNIHHLRQLEKLEKRVQITHMLPSINGNITD